MAHAVDHENLGMAGFHGLREGKLDGDARVVLADDEKDGDFGFGEDGDAGRSESHATLCCFGTWGGGLEAVVLEVFYFLSHVGAAAWVEEAANEAEDVACSVGMDLLYVSGSALPVFFAVGKCVGVDEAETTEIEWVFVGKGESDVAAKRVAYHDALLDASLVKDGFDNVGHKFHGVDIGEDGALAVTG